MKRKKSSKIAKAPERAPASMSAALGGARTTDIEEFQKAFGEAWVSIVQSRPFQEAMFLLNKKKLERITNLSDEDIERHSREIVADLKGHLKHEDDLMTLHTRTTEFPSEELEEYFSPEQSAELEMLRERFRKSNQESRYHA